MSISAPSLYIRYADNAPQLARWLIRRRSAARYNGACPFHNTTSTPLPKPLPPRPPLLPASEIESSALKGTGPGGQKINKSNTAIQLKHLPTGIVVKSQATRSRSQNMKIAQRLLADEVDVFLRGDESRKVVVGRMIAKKRGRGDRRRKKKYRERTAAAESAGGEGKDEDEDLEWEDDDSEELMLEGREGRERVAGEAELKNEKDLELRSVVDGFRSATATSNANADGPKTSSPFGGLRQQDVNVNQIQTQHRTRNGKQIDFTQAPIQQTHPPPSLSPSHSVDSVDSVESKDQQLLLQQFYREVERRKIAARTGSEVGKEGGKGKKAG